MKSKLFAPLAAAVALLVAQSASAGAVALADMDVKTFGFTNQAGIQSITFLNESRTGNASAGYNGVNAAINGSSNSPGATVDLAYQCRGDCTNATLNAAYGGAPENSVNFISPPATGNFALGDMVISGSIATGNGRGLTRADSVTMGATNEGTANATILNSGAIKGQFFVNTTFTTHIVLTVSYLLQTWIDPMSPANESSFASAGLGWNMAVSGLGVNLFARPDALNVSASSGDSSENAIFSGNNVFIDLGEVTFTAGQTYNFTINQSSNSSVSSLPEPASLALVGLGLLGVGLARRKARR